MERVWSSRLVLDSLEDLTARTRAVARSLPDLVRQLADLRSSLPRAALTAARDCQRHLERETAQMPGPSDRRSAAQHLARLTGEIISEVAEHQAGSAVP